MDENFILPYRNKKQNLLFQTLITISIKMSNTASKVSILFLKEKSIKL